MDREGRPLGPPSQNRPTKRKGVSPELRSAALDAAIHSVIQGLIWTALCTLSIFVYDGYIDIPDWRNTTGVTQYTTLLAHLYFTQDDPISSLPDDGILDSAGMNIIMIIFTAANGLWLVISSLVSAAVLISSVSVCFFWLYCWLFCCGVTVVLDVVLAALMVRDLVTLGEWDGLSSFPSDSTEKASTALLMCPGTVLIFALRAGVIFILNVVFLLRVARSMARERRALKGGEQQPHRPSVVDREGPIDAYFYGDGVHPGGGGVLNPMFEPGEDVNWMTFRAPPGQRDSSAPPPSAVRGMRQRPYHQQSMGKDDDGEDVSHLSWMAEVDKYIDSHVDGGDAQRQVSVRELRLKLQKHHSLGSQKEDGFDSIPRAKLHTQSPTHIKSRPPSYQTTHPNERYPGSERDYRGRQGHYQGPQGHYQGPQGHYQGPQGHYQGPQRHYQGPQGPYQGQRGHYQGQQGQSHGPQGYNSRHSGIQRHTMTDDPPFNIPPPDYTPPPSRRSFGNKPY